ncbi:hypothetical protein JOQ06_018982 [Pogonophryne albipinna]|uniref:ribonuclease H n=1 Tax=Pogonophryne albipinna TaxID=1090488 RepID=A0AAD6FCW7_9TELE|nr:hypothetical protein JOQ06_018982 [Pogonophryne albipinna]
MYAGTRARVVTPDGNSEEFDILAGVMQGDTLAPFLFIMVLDIALRKAINGREQDLGFTLTPRRSRRHPTVVLTDLDYVDDISLLSDSVEQAKELLNRVESECAKVGLRLNAKKTEVITYNILPAHPPLTTTEGTVLKEVKDFKYLGSWVNSTEQDLKYICKTTAGVILRIEISQQYNRYLSKNIATHRYVRDWSPVKVSWDRMLSGL